MSEIALLLTLGFCGGMLVGFSLWEVIDRSEWAAYRRIYRKHHDAPPPKPEEPPQ